MDALKPTFHYSRSCWPGGQHVNKSHTRVELRLDLETAPLAPETRRRLLALAGSRVDARGCLHLTSQASRSQSVNRRLTLRELARLLDLAGRRPARRRTTRIPPQALQAGRDARKRHARKKALRRTPAHADLP